MTLLDSMGALAQPSIAVVGWPYSPGVVPYLPGLLAGLIGSGSIFVHLVLIRPDQGV